MINRLLKECALDEPCSYIKGLKQTTHYRIIESCSKEYCELLVERGWRRFGHMFFRPICAECNACESLKIDVKAFELSKSMKRIMKKNAHLRLVVQKPTVSHEHIELFKNYHDYMGNKRGWNTQEVSQKNYYSSFVHAHHDYGYEILYYDNETLIAVDLIDILPNGVSSIYFYYNPKYEKNSLGKYSMYRQILYAKQQNLEWIHMGYYVKECQSLSYKSDYKPHLLLTNRPLDDENPQWITLPDR